MRISDWSSDVCSSDLPFAKVARREIVIDHRQRSAAVTLEIDAGPTAAFGALSVEGNERVRESYIRRLADIAQGAAFDTSPDDEMRRRLFASGLFETEIGRESGRERVCHYG